MRESGSGPTTVIENVGIAACFPLVGGGSRRGFVALPAPRCGCRGLAKMSTAGATGWAAEAGPKWTAGNHSWLSRFGRPRKWHNRSRWELLTCPGFLNCRCIRSWPCGRLRMKKSRFSERQIALILRQRQKLGSKGSRRSAGRRAMSEATYYDWRKSHLTGSSARRRCRLCESTIGFGSGGRCMSALPQQAGIPHFRNT